MIRKEIKKGPTDWQGPRADVGQAYSACRLVPERARSGRGDRDGLARAHIEGLVTSLDEEFSAATAEDLRGQDLTGLPGAELELLRTDGDEAMQNHLVVTGVAQDGTGRLGAVVGVEVVVLVVLAKAEKAEESCRDGFDDVHTQRL